MIDTETEKIKEVRNQTNKNSLRREGNSQRVSKANNQDEIKKSLRNYGKIVVG